MTIKIGDTVISRNKETNILKKNEPYTVADIIDNDLILEMGGFYGQLPYNKDWFEVVQHANEVTQAPSGYYDFQANNVGPEPLSSPLYLEEIPTAVKNGKLGYDPVEVTNWYTKTKSAKASHIMKSWTHFFQAIKKGLKKHDLRKMDRDFRVGQHIILKEYDNINGKYTGETLEAKITYITSEDVPCAFSSAVLEKGYAILSLEVVEETD